MARRHALLLAALLLSACAPAPRPAPPPALEPFRPAMVAWKIMIETRPELAPPRDAVKGPVQVGLHAFYGAVGERPRGEKSREQARACTSAWQGLVRAQKAAPELEGELEIGKAYLATRCGWSQKALPVLRRLASKRGRADLVFYAAHFYWGEALLEMERTGPAAEQYRYVLGEIESPLYPLALYRTAQCHWDADEVDQAAEYLQHVIDWAGDREEPSWVPELRHRAEVELRDFRE